MVKKKDQGISLFDKANEALDAGYEKLAFELMLEADRNGDKNAANSIGYFFDHGIGVKKDAASAYKWYRRAALRGDYLAYHNLGVCFRDAGNFRRAKFWFEKAYPLDAGSAAYELGKTYFNLRHSDISRKRASQHLAEAVVSENISEYEREEAKKMLLELSITTYDADI